MQKSLNITVSYSSSLAFLSLVFLRFRYLFSVHVLNNKLARSTIIQCCIDRMCQANPNQDQSSTLTLKVTCHLSAFIDEHDIDALLDIGYGYYQAYNIRLDPDFCRMNFSFYYRYI